MVVELRGAGIGLKYWYNQDREECFKEIKLTHLHGLTDQRINLTILYYVI